MPDVTQFLRSDGDPIRHPPVISGYISRNRTAPTSFSDTVWLISQGHSEDSPWGPCYFPAIHGNELPIKGSACTFLVDDAGVPVLVWWASAVTIPSYPTELPGVVKQYAGPTAPSGYLICNGASLLRTDYKDLFNAIGVTYGSADGTHFTIPDMRGGVPVGAGTGSGLTNRTLGAHGGTETLIKAEIPVHNHTGSTGTGSTGTGVTGTGSTGTGSTGTGSTGTGTSGGDSGHTHSIPSLTGDFNSFLFSAGGTGATATATAGSANAYTATRASTTGSGSGHTHSVPALSVPSLSVPSLSVPALSVPALSVPALSIANDGSGSADSKMQPYVVLNYIIKT